MNIKETALSIALVLSCNIAQALEIKGIEIDKPTNCLLLRNLDRFRSLPKECINKETAWIQEISFLSHYGRFLFDQTNDGILRSVSITDFPYLSALIALTEKYGPPKTKQLKITTTTGAELIDNIHIWQDGSTKLMLQQHGNSINSPSIIFFGVLYEQEIQKINQTTNKNI